MQLCKWHVSSLPRAWDTLSSRDSQFPWAGIQLAGPISGRGRAMVCGIKTSIIKETAGGKQEEEIGKETWRVRRAGERKITMKEGC